MYYYARSDPVFLFGSNNKAYHKKVSSNIIVTFIGGKLTTFLVFFKRTE